jgi:uncharacterized repeat protein (TIGR01451 family)
MPAQPAILAPSATLTCTAQYTITVSDAVSGQVTNVASATGQSPVGPVTAEANAVVHAQAIGGLAVSKTASPSGVVQPGQVVTFTIVVTNTANVPATGVAVSDPLPGLSALTCNPAAPATLAPGASMMCTATYTVTDANAAAGSVANTATATGSAGGGAVSASGATIVGVAPPTTVPTAGSLPGTGPAVPLGTLLTIGVVLVLVGSACVRPRRKAVA